MQVTIDGPASSGKSTIAKLLAKRYHFIYLDTGAMYRAVTWLALQKGINLDKETAFKPILEEIQIEFKQAGELQKVFVNQVDVTTRIREKEITAQVSKVSSYPSVRAEMVKRQREIASKDSIVMDGRDIGTVVLPNAEVKIFLVASAEERARRRYEENVAKGIETSDIATLLNEIKTRDYLDSTRQESPLKKAEDAIEIDSTQLTIEEVTNEIAQQIEKMAKK